MLDEEEEIPDFDKDLDIEELETYDDEPEEVLDSYGEKIADNVTEYFDEQNKAEVDEAIERAFEKVGEDYWNSKENIDDEEYENSEEEENTEEFSEEINQEEETQLASDLDEWEDKAETYISDYLLKINKNATEDRDGSFDDKVAECIVRLGFLLNKILRYGLKWSYRINRITKLISSLNKILKK